MNIAKKVIIQKAEKKMNINAKKNYLYLVNLYQK